MGTTLRTAVAMLACCMAFGPVATAHAQSSSGQGYDETSVLGTTGAGRDASSDTAARVGPATVDLRKQQGGGRLPFTGTDLLVFGLLGTALIGTGITVRRATRSG
jgi:hypothetical protein